MFEKRGSQAVPSQENTPASSVLDTRALAESVILFVPAVTVLGAIAGLVYTATSVLSDPGSSDPPLDAAWAYALNGLLKGLIAFWGGIAASLIAVSFQLANLPWFVEVIVLWISIIPAITLASFLALSSYSPPNLGAMAVVAGLVTLTYFAVTRLVHNKRRPSCERRLLLLRP